MESSSKPFGGEGRHIPLSAVNQFLFCPRRAALIHVEGTFEDNEHTVLGELAHEHADLPGYEVAKGVKLLRALPVFSDRLVCPENATLSSSGRIVRCARLSTRKAGGDDLRMTMRSSAPRRCALKRCLAVW